jgi:DNA repair protein SbcC/Rad50
MKLKLINFKCYLEKTFEFDDNNFILISASSGSGKSTILMAIQYALYGTGSNVKHYGKSNCSVELEYDGMKIVRIKRKRVIINDEYEDEIAQNIINKKFGDAFHVTSYIAQLALNSFILMNPTSKLEFLEKFAFKDVNLVDIKNKCKNLINQKNEELNKTIYQLELATNILKELKEPEEIKCPFKCKDNTIYEKYIKNEEIKNVNCDKRIKKAKDTINKTQKEINELNILNSYIESKTDFIDSLCDELNNLSIEESDIMYQGDDKLKEYKERLNILLSRKEFETINNKYNEDVKKLEQMKDEEIEKYEKEISFIDSKLWKEYTKEECESSIKDTKDILKDAKRVSFLEKQIDICISQKELESLKIELENYRVQLDIKRKILDAIKQQDKIYSCPSCKSNLHFKNDKLCINTENQITNDIDEKEVTECIKNLNNKIKKLELSVPNEENKIIQQAKIKKEIELILSQYEDELNEISIEEDLQALENYYKTQLRLENKKDSLEESLKNDEFSSSYKLFQKDVLKLKQKINNLNINDFLVYDEKYSEEELRNIIIDEQNIKEQLERINKKRNKIKEDNLKYKKQIDELKTKFVDKYSSIKTIDELNLIIDENKNIINDNEIKKEKCLKNLENIEKYNNYLIEIEKYESLKTKIKNLENKEMYERKKYNAVLLFKENILQAESIAMYNIIESINIHAQAYLDNFFIDNPIIVKLLSFKEAKNDNKLDKAQINIEIDYKGNECELNDLSGGEISRIVLAFTLALCEMFNSPILLLDECTSSLNQELATSVFDTIKDNFKSTTVLVVAHQVIEGVFDQIIKL